jgi:hypothetical protein
MTRRTGLKVREAAFVIGVGYMRAHRMAASGELERGATGICPRSVLRAAERLSSPGELPLRRQALELLLQGRIDLPKPNGRYGPPLPIVRLPDLLVPRVQCVPAKPRRVESER